MGIEIVNSECLEHLMTLDDDSIDSIVTDPPYGLAFMGVGWDTFASEVGKRNGGCRVDAKFDQVGGNHHATSSADQCRTRKIENSKFQEKMTPVFEELLRVAKPGAHLLCFGGTRTYHRITCAIEDAGWEIRDCIMWLYGSGMPKGQNVAKAIMKRGGSYEKWDGWNTALKPAWEPIILARKAPIGSVAANVLEYGTGALNVDACRVPVSDDDDATQGRFPANVCHDGSQLVLDLFPQSKGQQGDVTGNEPSRPADGVCYGEYNDRLTFVKRGDTGSSARFFYCAKASKKDRGEGNDHPTVKPTSLMEWLVKMVTPPGGTVLDPFMGSGSTLVAAKNLGLDAIGIEMDAHYCDIARSRLS